MEIKNYERELKYLVSDGISFDMILNFLDNHRYSLVETKLKKKHEIYYDDNNLSFIKKGDVIRSSTHYNSNGTYFHFMYKKNVSIPSKPYVSKYEFGSGRYTSVNEFLAELNINPESKIAPILHAEMTRETCVVEKGDYRLLISYDNVKYYKYENGMIVWEKMLEIEDWTTPHTTKSSDSKYDAHLCDINKYILGNTGLPVQLIKDSKPYRGIILLSENENWRYKVMNNPAFGQLGLFVQELLRIIDEGQKASIVDICTNIEQGTITDFIYAHYGFKNVNVTLESITDVNKIMKRKYVSEREAEIRGINNNGLVFLAHLIVEDLTRLLYDMKFNKIDPESYRYE